MRRFLFSKWFFGLLLFVLLFDLLSDVAEHLIPQHHQVLNYASILFDAIGFILVLWMFIDLSRIRAAHGDHPDRG